MVSIPTCLMLLLNCGVHRTIKISAQSDSTSLNPTIPNSTKHLTSRPESISSNATANAEPLSAVQNSSAETTNHFSTPTVFSQSPRRWATTPSTASGRLVSPSEPTKVVSTPVADKPENSGIDNSRQRTHVASSATYYTTDAGVDISSNQWTTVSSSSSSSLADVIGMQNPSTKPNNGVTPSPTVRPRKGVRPWATRRTDARPTDFIGVSLSRGEFAGRPMPHSRLAMSVSLLTLVTLLTVFAYALRRLNFHRHGAAANAADAAPTEETELVPAAAAFDDDDDSDDGENNPAMTPAVDHWI